MSDAQQSVAEKPAAEDAPAAQTTESTAPAASATLPDTNATETKPETSATDASKTEGEASAAPKQENAEGEKAKAVSEPITHGSLGYKAPGLMKQLKFSKNYFWFGDEAIPQQHMDKFMRGEKPEISYPTTAWASHTGKGLLLFVKYADQKKTPDGAINLADVSDLTKEGSRDFSLKYHGHKHTFQASNEERDGWVVAIEKAAEEAKGSKEGILGSDKYKDTISKLNKPATLATGAAAAATGNKSTDAARTDEPTEGRKNSSEAENGKKKSKSRSVSRGNKRSSLFGSLMGKKEEKDEQKEVKKEEKAEEKAEKEEKKEEKAAEKEEKKEEKKDAKEGEVAAAGTAAAGTSSALDAPATAERATADTAVEDKKTTEPAAEKNTTGTGKSTKRGSIFGSFFEKVRSPTSEKKEADVAPVPPPKDDVAPVLPPTDGTDDTAPPAPPKDKPEEAAATGAATAAATEEAKETKEAKNEKATTPSKEKEGFFKRLLSESKVKGLKPEATKEESKEGAEAAAVEESAKEAETTEATADKTAEPATENSAAPVTDAAVIAPTEKKEETSTPKESASTPKESKRSSIFGTFKSKDKKGDKSDAEKSEGEEKKANKLGGIFRNPSKAIKSNKESKKEETKPTVEGDKEDKKADEIAATKADPLAKEAVENLSTVQDKRGEAKKEQSIGDVVPEAVSVGQPQEQGAPPVQATA